MIKKSDPNERRVLSYPAVQLCPGVSSATLIASLIDLSQSVCKYQSKFFATQRRNAREAIREIGILLIFFEEIRDRGLVLPDSIILLFSELHYTLQKVLFLLEDCVSEGARIWILMKSQFVTTQFRVLIRAIATVLDVLPLDSVDVGGEVKELVELVSRQARKVKIELDPEDEWAREQVSWILSLFEKGIVPDLGFVKWVLDHLEIKSWSECNKEVEFLEEQICFQSSEREEKDVPFLSSLLGLMCYCRVVIFDTYDREYYDAVQTETRHNSEVLTCLNPEDFRCPISLELMIDPVTISTGQTYDRSSIEKWFKAGNNICPKTGEKLTNLELVPNTTLRKLIKQFCSDNGICVLGSRRKARDVTRTILPGSLASAEAIKFLSRFITRKLVFGSSEEKNKAAYEVRLLAKSNIFNRTCLIESGAVLPLLNLLSSSSCSTQENAIAALLKLSKHSNGKKVITENNGIKPILEVVKNGLTLEVKQIAAATIFYLASVKGYGKLISETPDTILALVELIKNGTTCGKKNAIVAIFALLLHPGTHEKVLKAQTVPLLVNLLSKDELRSDSLAVLAVLSETSNGTHEITQASGLHSIMKILQSMPSKHEKEYCVSILLCMCNNGGDQVIEVLAKDPTLIGLLYSLMTDGTSRCSVKSRAVIEILHKFNDTSSSSRLVSPSVRREWPPVHVR